MEGDRGRGVAGDWLSGGRDVQLDRGASLHHWQGFCLADIEDRGLELVDQEGFELSNILLGGGVGETNFGLGPVFLAGQLHGDSPEQDGVVLDVFFAVRGGPYAAALIL